MASLTESMRPTMRRSVPLSRRSDLQVRRMSFRGATYWTVKDPIALRYYRLRDEQYHLLTRLDGQCTLEELQAQLQQAFPQFHWGLVELQSLISDLHEKRLLVSDRSGQSEGIGHQRQKSRRQKYVSGLMSLLFIRFPGIYPEPFLRFCYPWIRRVFHPVAILVVVTAVLAAMGLLAVHFDQARQQMPEFQQFFAWPNLLYLWLTMAVVKVFHELGHGFTCHHFGSESHAIGPMLLVFSPTLYCDVSDSWMLPNKWHRIAIGAAGMYVEVFLSAIALFVWWNTRAGTLHHLALNVFFVTTVTTVIFNANPLMRFDGYYIFSDLVEIPNLQQRSSRWLLDWIGWNCFGIEARPDPFEPERGRGWVIAYALAAGLYRWFILFGIGVFLYTVLKPWRLQNLGVTLTVFSVSMMVGQFLYQVIKMVRTPRTQPLSRMRMVVTGLVVAAVVVMVARIPVPVFIQAAAMIQPHDVQHVHVETPGVLTEIYVQSGDRVERTEPLARLSNPELDDRVQQLETEIAVQKQRRVNAAAQRDPSGIRLAENALASRQDQLHEVERQADRLTLTAPVEGRVVSAERRDSPKHSPEDRSLDTWYGDPSDERNEGAWFDTNTHWCSIAPDDLFEVILYVDQSDRNELQPGRRVRMKFDHLPDEVYEGEITELSEEAVSWVPAVLSNKTGGPLPTVTEEGGRERLTSVAWQARVLLDRDQSLFVSGLRGRARLLVSHRSLGSWLWRWVRKTVHFRL